MGARQLVLKCSVSGGVFALQQTQCRQHAGCGADGGYLFACLCKGGASVGHRLVGGKVRRTGNAAGQHHQIYVGIIDFLRQCIGGDVHLMAAQNLPAAGSACHQHLHLGAAEQVHHQQCLALLGAFRKKHNSFCHKNNLPYQISKRKAACRSFGQCPFGGTRPLCQSADFFSASSSARSTLSSALSTRLTRLMMALDAPVLSMISV